LPASERKRLAAHLEPVTLSAHTVLYEIGAPFTYVYLPQTAVVSWVNATDGKRVEAATMGREGVVGLLALWGTAATFGQAVVQVPGEATRIRSDLLQKTAPPGTPLHQAFCRYMKALIHQLAQSVACNALHSVKQRCCRWLLSTQDRVLSDQLPVTQDMLARVLGVRRAGVGDVMRDLQSSGLIRCQRGAIVIGNRQGLTTAACACYGILKDVFDDLLGPDGRP
jgi:CRP-like cAMP-binding protein